MTEKPEKSLIDQILDEMFVIIEEQEEFDEQTILSLKELRENKELSKQNQVKKAITVISGDSR